jgi:single-stranded DNA-binding protein
MTEFPSPEIPLDGELARSLDRQRTVNRSQLTGRVVATPSLSTLGSFTQVATLLLATAEFFQRRGSGDRGHHINLHLVQVLGKDAERASQIALGSWATVDGYQRTDSGGPSVVRVYSINAWEDDESVPTEARDAQGVEVVPRPRRSSRRP